MPAIKERGGQDASTTCSEDNFKIYCYKNRRTWLRHAEEEEAAAAAEGKPSLSARMRNQSQPELR